MKKLKKQSGFTLIELMIVIAIVGVLAAVAVPMYKTYTTKAKFAEVVSMAGSVKAAMSTCLQSADLLANCNSFAEIGIRDPSATSPQTTSITIASTSATAGTITAVSADATDPRTYILTLAYVPATGSAAWTVGGTCSTTAPAIC